MFLLVPAHPGFPGQIPQSRKTVVCCVCNRQKEFFLNSKADGKRKTGYNGVKLSETSIG